MLRQLFIRNFVLVEELDLELAAGLTTITGETGAGKSILLDAIGLALGDRANPNLIRPGSERAEILLDFDIAGHAAVADWLAEHELDEQGTCEIRRTIGRDGRSRAYINGRPVSVQWLRELGEQLIDIHSQHAHQSLMQGSVQRELLDAYSGCTANLETLTRHYQQWQTLTTTLADLRESERERHAALDLIRYQLEELHAAALKENEWPQLETELKQLANIGELRNACAAAVHFLDSEGADQLNQAAKQLAKATLLDSKLSNISQCFEGAAIQLKEATSELRHYLDALDDDPARLQQVETRISELHSLARKHHIEPDALLALQNELNDKWQTLEQETASLASLEQDIAVARANYLATAKNLSQQRAAASEPLAAAISDNMRLLGMPQGRFAIALQLLPESQYGPFGLERIEFLVSTNPGQELMPLTKVASGGELSRISLAIQVINADRASIATYIFDEVDVGVGGGIADTIGKTLRRLSACHQVLCVTHLPQVAALGHHQLKVEKVLAKDMTNTRVMALTTTQRQEEIARMLAGTEITDSARHHAQDLIRRGAANALAETSGD